MSSWICNGIPKNGQTYSNASGEHENHENYGPDCEVCRLPREAMENSTKPQTTRFIGHNSGTSSSLLLLMIISTVVLFLIIGGVSVFFLIGNSSNTTNNNDGDTPIINTNTNTKPNTSDSHSDNVSNSDKISQGEKILLDSTQEKETAAASFAKQDWQKATTEYKNASKSKPNDPESKIYLQNALAREAGNPLTIAAVVPIGTSPDSAAEILRGVARYQEEFNLSPLDGKLLEVVIVNNSDVLIASSLADDLINTSNILGVLGYGVDPASQKAIRKFNDAGMAVLSPLTTSLDKSVLQTIPVDQKSGQLLTNYLQAVSKTLSEFAQTKNPSVKAIIYYNSDSPYSMQLKQELTNSLTKSNGQLLQEIDIVNNDDFVKDLKNIQQKGANTLFLALSKNKVPDAIKIAQANTNLSSPLAILGGDELYNPNILVQGGNAIDNLILAVPWSFNPNDPFAKDAIQSWKGRVSWRTATAYDATKALGEAIRQDPTRSGTVKLLNQGITMKNSTTDFNIFNEVPLVKAVKGNNGPPGAKYQFDSIK